MRNPPSGRRVARPYTRVLTGITGAVAVCAVLTVPTAAAPPGTQPQSETTAATAAAGPEVRLPDGLAQTPPMGFNNWNSTHCRAEFDHEMVKGIADIFVEKGLKDAGYEYVNIDDCWALPERDANGKLVPDPVRFPDGIKAVADYVHSKGLKFGIYTSAGTKTCNQAGFPGSLGHEESDAQQFADWGVDYLKYDNCNNQGVDAVERYTKMRDALKATGRPIVYSICEWGENDPWEWAADVGHLWRTTGDISDNWSSVLGIMKQNLPLAEHAGPGHWNDPDMLEVGNGGMTDTEYRTHFSMWSIMAAPLLIGSDLRGADEATFEILGNEEVIAVDQDPLGKQGTVVSSEDGRWVVSKEMADGSRTVALFNESGSPQEISTTAGEVGLPAAGGYRLRDLWQHQDRDSGGEITAAVPAHGTVLYRVWPDADAGSPPAGTTFASDWEWYLARNGWGPAERDTSVGERPAGDGAPLTVGGETYAKGLGVHAPGEIGYYTAEECETFAADVGLDDESGGDGSVAFEVWADDAKVAESGVLTNDRPAQPLSADVGGAQTVRLVVTDGGDGIDHDHADWADARFTC
ncbi:NPCBM/NEW2 domain-containing protein [Streptomyces sp. WMMC500]|uniref:NPCBM/NEW2 domain-containing protein n=1 Tax=Streptomyces sp. WMMC500 TaxID=3015154 RepID=UPI00248C1477|nr:NPCBM/NEW2 domain-containing protein [Streptomyces sp. WMMC500]WBB60709.1 NPCBM/NEW2 domain-containing protein [Streptomyces sp. WMMC500]